MAKFLNTSGVSYYLEELIKNTQSKLVLVSPYLQFNDRIRQHIQNLSIRKKDIRIIYRESNLQIDEKNWLASQTGVRTLICKNLHAKCYINDGEAIITSMNLYEFSQVNNNEMGIYITREGDPDLYMSTYEEVERLLAIGNEVGGGQNETAKNSSRKILKVDSATRSGFCIRTGVSVPFDLERPLSKEAHRKWSEFGDPDYPEKYCHFSGEQSNGETSLRQPVLKKNWKKAKEVFNL